MRHFAYQKLCTGNIRLSLLCLTIILLHGCAGNKPIQPPFPFPPMTMQERIETNQFILPQGDSVIGQPAYLKIEEGDTLPDIARHFSLGVTAVSAANPGLDIWVPKTGEYVLLPLNFVLPDAPQKGIVINLAAMRLFQFKPNGAALTVLTYPVGIGTSERPTPYGKMRVERKMAKPTWYVPASIAEDHRKKGDPLPSAISPGPLNPLGEYALYLSKSTYLIHGTNKPASIGLRATNGCIRLYPEDIKRLFGNTAVHTPVYIVNQPFLVGERDGVVYLEAHAPFENTDPGEASKMQATLKNIEKKSGRPLDWSKIITIITEAKGIPVPISEIDPEGRQVSSPPIEIKHPARLYGKPEVPSLKAGGWYILATTTKDETDAKRISAIINHQGPPIPARVLTKNNNYHVIAGPFDTLDDAGTAKKRLKIDLEIDSLIIDPSMKK